jgi:hypothetical protein
MQIWQIRLDDSSYLSNTTHRTIENPKICEGQPNLENRIISPTLTDRLLGKGFRLLFRELIDTKPCLLTGTNDPARLGYLKPLLHKALKVPGFRTSLPRKGTETVNLLRRITDTGFRTSLPRKGTETAATDD